MDDWKQIEVAGVPLLVNAVGDVRTLDRETPYVHTRLGKSQTLMMKFKGRQLRPAKTKAGYIEVATCHKGRKVSKFLVHRLVALAFVPGYQDGMWVNHKNGDKTDNSAANLEWVTPGQNSRHAWETGLVDLKGEKQPNAKLTEKRVAYIRKLLNQGISANTLAIIAGVSPSLINLIRDGERWAGVEAAE